MTKVYMAHAMTGRTGHDLLEESRNALIILASSDIEVLDPVLVERIKDTKKPIANIGPTLMYYWRRDKQMIRRAHVVLDLSGPLKSEGVAHEIGYARYCLWKPVVRIWPGLGPSVARLEDDYICETVEEAAKLINRKWGTFAKRLVWRFCLITRSLPRFVLWQLGEWK